MNVIDLTHTITRQIPVFPGDPAVDIPEQEHFQDGYMVSRVTFGTHTGTHIDAPLHKLPGGKPVDEIPLSALMGRAFVLPAKDLPAVTYDDLQPYKGKVTGVSALIIKTGWAGRFNKDGFFTDFPGIEQSAVTWFIENGIKLIGLESPSVHPVKHAEIHASLLQNDIIIVESLANAESITQEYVDFCAVPLKLKGLDGSPVRAFAIQRDAAPDTRNFHCV